MGAGSIKLKRNAPKTADPYMRSRPIFILALQLVLEDGRLLEHRMRDAPSLVELGHALDA